MHAHPLADPAKGTGIAMVCTFGDLTDVTWWRDLRAGHPGGDRPRRPAAARAAGRACPRRPYAAARRADRRTPPGARWSSLLARVAATCIGEPRPITHPVKFYESGDTPLEIVTTPAVVHPQRRARRRSCATSCWRAAGELRWVPGAHAPPVRALGGRPHRRLADQPAAVLRRADPGVVPARRRTASRTTTEPLMPDEADLPVDPSSDVPPATPRPQRGEPGGFAADPDVMDTWATSSLTPQIVGGWETDPDLFARVFPMDLRPQGHEIIRTWLFATVVRAHVEHGVLPWHDAVHLRLDPRPRPQEDVQVARATWSRRWRCWSSTARTRCATGRPAAGPGIDLAFDPAQMQGRPAAGDQAAQRVEVRARPGRRRPRCGSR